MSKTDVSPDAATVLGHITAWWLSAVERARQEKDEAAFAKTMLAVMRAEDLDGLPFLWRDTVARDNSYPACRGTVMDVSDPRTDICLPYRRLATALKTLIRLVNNHCLGMETLWERYGMDPPTPLTREACREWIEKVLRDAPAIMQCAVDAAARGEGLLPVVREAEKQTVE